MVLREGPCGVRRECSDDVRRQQEHFLSCIVDVAPRVGMRALVLWTDGLYYPGTIVKMRRLAGRCMVSFDDGNISSVTLNTVHVVEAAGDAELGPRKRLRREQHAAGQGTTKGAPG